MEINLVQSKTNKKPEAKVQVMLTARAPQTWK